MNYPARDSTNPFDFRIPWPITTDNASTVLATVQSAQQAGETVRERVLSAFSPGTAALPIGCNRPVATVAENLAVAAMKLGLSRLDTAEGRADPTLHGYVARYNECSAAFADASSLIKEEDWTTLSARYGSMSRDAAPGCMKVIALVTLVCLEVITRLRS